MAADTQYGLNDATPESRFFRRIAELGHYAGAYFHTRQGIYICSPSGDLLGSTVAADADSVFALMQSSLRSTNRFWESHDVLATDDGAELVRWEDSFPSDGMVLRMVSRDLPVERVSDEPPISTARSRILRGPRFTVEPRRLNYDHVWFSKHEAHQWLPELEKPGATHTLPEALRLRFVRFHLLDAVGGELPRKYLRDEVEIADLATTVTNRQGSRVSLRITGASSADAPRAALRASARRVETTILGFATYDLQRETFVEFEMIALGTRAEFCGLGDSRELDPRGIGFFFSLAEPSDPVVAPHFVQRYDVDWLTRPPRPAATEPIRTEP